MSLNATGLNPNSFLRFCLTKMDRRFNEFYIKLKTS